mmetsp:Transcript_129980/g.363840  ORF Transcript_129980/g.363840 Transcript_129980/m.363840 type:complete len:206 (+) Transcript_129980:672-1289(+)
MPGKRFAKSRYFLTHKSLKRCSKPGGKSASTFLWITSVGKRLRCWKPRNARDTSSSAPGLSSARRAAPREQLPSVSDGKMRTGKSSARPASLQGLTVFSTSPRSRRSSTVGLPESPSNHALTSGNIEGSILHACEKRLNAILACCGGSSLNEPRVTTALPASRQIAGSSGARSSAPSNWSTPSCHLMKGSSLDLSSPFACRKPTL